MRVPTIAPADLDAPQRAIYDDMSEEIAKDFRGFKTKDDAGGLLGPFNVWMSEPVFGRPIWDLIKTMVLAAKLPRTIREVAILVTGAHFRSAYEIYAHVALAESGGLSDEKISTIITGQRPIDLTKEEALAYDIASALVEGHVLPELTYGQAVRTWGERPTKELIYLVGVYCFVSITLNGFDIPIPDPQ